ncbi:hypothetical protein Asppvi_007932 [Aspergillus pseudoviridinutans]|uniref:Uncharacterized protein n=1 Tax=Aspergillus pseudoviridinutans TaxID=1517512 RepID=A0A9P3EUX9_9EURO|nr:uncharacterized protein Asppvi_007932 [Aspergillus pseudoviridinutans]GIJ89004.1 hypothetical protein Asppvi_007932 [Aspergillus pseudoviridinutans]
MKSKDPGVEREMRICHTQPHLVPPMKLVVYDDLPSPTPRTSSFPSWITEGRSVVSRASKRASMSFKRQSTPLRISAPTDFRRVETFHSFASSPAEFQPLVLKIHTPGNRLSDLPTFDDFLSQEDRRRSLAWPAKALVSPTDPSRISRARSHHHSSSFQLPRKPVGSGSRRSSLAALEQLLDKQSPITSPGIPYFSARTSTATGLSEALFSPTYNRLESSPGYGSLPQRQRQRSDTTSIAVPPKTPPKTPLQDRPLPPLPTDNTPSSTGTSTPNPSSSTLAENDISSPTPSRTGRVAQWLLQTGNKAFIPASPPVPWKPRAERSASASASAFRIRSRTLSGSTAVSSAPSTTTTTGLGPRTPPSRGTQDLNPSLPSEKDLEAFPSRALFSHAPPALSSTSMSIPDDRPYPTIYEGQQQQFAYSELDYYSTPNHRQSTIGLAF